MVFEENRPEAFSEVSCIYFSWKFNFKFNNKIFPGEYMQDTSVEASGGFSSKTHYLYSPKGCSITLEYTKLSEMSLKTKNKFGDFRTKIYLSWNFYL